MEQPYLRAFVRPPSAIKYQRASARNSIFVHEPLVLSECAKRGYVLELHCRTDSRAQGKSLTHSKQIAEERKECLRTSKRTRYNMSVAKQLAEFARLTVERIMIIINETSTSTEGSVQLQNSTTSGEKAVRKHQTSKKFRSLLVEVFNTKHYF